MVRQMITYIALLRGINVGGNNKIPMAALREALQQTGFDAIQTYIQSGNVIFTSEFREKNQIQSAIEQCITDTFGLRIAVFVCTAQEWQTLHDTNPLIDTPEKIPLDPKQHHLTLLSAAPDESRIYAIQPTNFAPDRFSVIGQYVYLHTPDGYGKTLLTNGFFEKTLGVKATTRNWRTVAELKKMSTQYIHHDNQSV